MGVMDWNHDRGNKRKCADDDEAQEDEEVLSTYLSNMKDMNDLVALRRQLGLSDSYPPFSKRIETYVTEASKIQKDTLIGQLQKIVDAIQKRKPKSYKRTDYEDFYSIVDALDIKVQNEKLSQDVKYEIALAKRNGYEAILAIENARKVSDRTEETDSIIAECETLLQQFPPTK